MILARARVELNGLVALAYASRSLMSIYKGAIPVSGVSEFFNMPYEYVVLHCPRIKHHALV